MCLYLFILYITLRRNRLLVFRCSSLLEYLLADLPEDFGSSVVVVFSSFVSFRDHHIATRVNAPMEEEEEDIIIVWLSIRVLIITMTKLEL